MTVFEKRLTAAAYTAASSELRFFDAARERAKRDYNAQNAANFAADLIECGEPDVHYIGIEQHYINSYAYEWREKMIEKLIALISLD